jgi:hypothetical protein
MNHLSKSLGDGTGLPITTTLGQLFPIDTYGYPRYIDFILPNGHGFDFQTIAINGFNYNGDLIRIVNDMSNGNFIWRFTIYESDESKNNKTWMNHTVKPIGNNQMYFIAYY